MVKPYADELRKDIQDLPKQSNIARHWLYILLRDELSKLGYWRRRAGGKGFAKGHDPRRIKLTPKDK